MYGDLKLHGKSPSVTWTKLSTDARAGSKLLKLSEPVDWASGSEIIVTPTSFDVSQLERLTVGRLADDGYTVVVQENLQFNHGCRSEDLPSGDSYVQCAEVGLLTRNIKISGTPDEDFYGGRLVIGYHTIKIGNDYLTYRGKQINMSLLFY